MEAAGQVTLISDRGAASSALASRWRADAEPVRPMPSTWTCSSPDSVLNEEEQAVNEYMMSLRVALPVPATDP